MMKRLTIFLFAFAFQFYGKCDTIANWQVYYNEDLLAKFNATQSKLSVALPKENRKDSDAILVEYYQDLYCGDCFSWLIIEDPESGYSWTDLGSVIMLKDLIATKKSRFRMYRMEMTGDQNFKTFLFELTL